MNNMEVCWHIHNYYSRFMCFYKFRRFSKLYVWLFLTIYSPSSFYISDSSSGFFPFYTTFIIESKNQFYDAFSITGIIIITKVSFSFGFDCNGDKSHSAATSIQVLNALMSTSSNTIEPFESVSIKNHVNICRTHIL